MEDATASTAKPLTRGANNRFARGPTICAGMPPTLADC
jgi:hypothetical protein